MNRYKVLVTAEYLEEFIVYADSKAEVIAKIEEGATDVLEPEVMGRVSDIYYRWEDVEQDEIEVVSNAYV